MEGSRSGTPTRPTATATGGESLEGRARTRRGYGFSASGPRRLTRWYSRFVGAMKVLLPLIALLLVALVVIWPHLKTQDLKFRIGFAALNLGEDKEPAMINPRFVGTDKNNQPYTITADLARRITDQNSQVELEMPKADITLKDGTWLVLTAQTGLYDSSARTLDLKGNVNLFHDSGYEFLTSAAKIDLAKDIAYGTQPVEGQGPFGQINAQGFKLLDKGKTIYFTGKSKLVLYPGAKQGAQK